VIGDTAELIQVQFVQQLPQAAKWKLKKSDLVMTR
jgi:hypothetical protein